MNNAPRKPRAIRLDQVDDNGQEPTNKPVKTKPQPHRKPRVQKDLAVLVPIPDEAAQASTREDDAVVDALTPPPVPVPRKRFSFLNLLLITLGGLISLGFALAFDQLIRELFQRNIWLGWAASVLTVLAVVGALGIIIRELAGLIRSRRIEHLRLTAGKAMETGDLRSAGRLINQLLQLYDGRPDTANGRAKTEAHHGEIIDGPDLVRLAERDLIAPLDTKARKLVMNSAKRVSLVTAISPRAIVDLAYVAMENIRLIRQLAELYGGRPGTLGIIKLARNVIAHLAVTGSIAIGDSIIQQFVGQGLAARLSSRLGEGVVNGLLTARIGISAIDLCRPLPFNGQKRPGIGDFMGDLLSSASPAKDQQKTNGPTK